MKNTYNLLVWDSLSEEGKRIANDFMKQTLYWFPEIKAENMNLVPFRDWKILCQNMAVIAATVAEKKELVITNY